MEIKVGGVLFMKSFLIGVKRVFLPTFLVITVSLLNLSYTHTLHSRRYKGHKNSDYKLDSSLSHDDAYIVSGSEDGRICFWDLVEVQLQFTVLALDF